MFFSLEGPLSAFLVFVFHFQGREGWRKVVDQGEAYSSELFALFQAFARYKVLKLILHA